MVYSFRTLLSTVEGWIDKGAQSLLKLRAKINTERVGEPAKLLIVTATGYGRPDGTTVVPITALGL